MYIHYAYAYALCTSIYTIKELEDRERRKNNLIFHNLKESTEATPQGKRLDDADKTRSNNYVRTISRLMLQSKMTKPANSLHSDLGRKMTANQGQ